MKYKILFLFSLISISIFGQQEEAPGFSYQNILPGDKLFATPDVAAFHKINFMPVNLYTGRVDITIPIFEIKTGNISVPISLSYNTGGVKVDDEASSVGLGWNLNAGGSIMRIVKDVEDHTITWGWEWYIYFDEYYRKTRYVTSKGSLATYNDFYEKYPDGKFTSTSSSYSNEDSSSDLFLANAPGLSTKFHMERKTKEKYYARVLNPNGVLIDTVYHKKQSFADPTLIKSFGFKDDALNHWGQNMVQGVASTATNNQGKNNFFDYFSFSLINMNGLKYEFNKADIIETLPDFFSQSFDPYDEIMMHINNNYSIKYGAWHLGKIVDPSTNRKVEFEYIPTINNYIHKKKMHIYNGRVSDAAISNLIPECDCFYKVNPDIVSDYNLVDEMDGQITMFKNTLSQKIQKITWDGGTVEFEYNLSRADAYNETGLTDIIVKNNNGDIVKRIKLNYSYFIAKEEKDTPEGKRLRLDNIEDGIDGRKQVYTFDYNYTSPLPKVGSLEQDYLGFYNNNGAKYTKDKWGWDKAPKPSIYFAPNQGQYSILPFKVNTTDYITYTPIHNGISLESNGYSLMGILNKITYPTGGMLRLEYENHKFWFKGSTITAGGARIKKQILNDGKGNEQVFEYEYVDRASNGSGVINNVPKYGEIKTLSNTKEVSYWDPVEGEYIVTKPADYSMNVLLYNRGRSEIELTDGGFVGYSRVVEKQKGNGYKEYYYFTADTYPNERETTNETDPCVTLAMKHSLYPGLAYVDNDIRRGRLESESTYNNENFLVNIKKFKYEYSVFNTKEFSFGKLEVRESMIPPKKKGDRNIKYNFKLKSRAERNVLSQIYTTEYLGGYALESTSQYTYDKTYPLLKETLTKNSNQEELKVKYFYPLDLTVDAQLKEASNLLISENRINELLKKEEYNSTSLLSKNYVVFGKDATTNNLLLPKNIFAQKGSETAEEEATIHNYDSSGNPNYIVKDQGLTKVVYLWGYNGLYPVAEIKNATYDEVKNNLGIEINKLSEAKSPDMSIIEALRAKLPNSFISTYTYKPQVGMLTATDPSGQTIYYTYDSFGRLIQTYIMEGNIKKIIQTNEYHFQEK